MRRLILVISASLLFTECTQHHQGSPEAIAAQYVAARYDYDWEKVSNLLHPESLEQFKVMMITLNHGLDSLNRLTGGKTKRDSMLNHIRSDKVQVLSPDMFFKSVMDVSLPTETMRQSSSHLIPTIKSLGYVAEGSDSAHVVQRVLVIRDGVPMNGIQCISLKRFEGQWRVLLPDELRNYMKMRLQTQRAF
jgi:hypothetical protein